MSTSDCKVAGVNPWNGPACMSPPSPQTPVLPGLVGLSPKAAGVYQNKPLAQKISICNIFKYILKIREAFQYQTGVHTVCINVYYASTTLILITAFFRNVDVTLTLNGSGTRL